jgi:type I restriction enzyme, S subunit
LGDVFAQTSTRAREVEEPPVFSITKYDGVVLAADYFDKRIASDSIANYKVLEPEDWAYSTIHIDEGSIARNNLGSRGAVSPMYTTMRFTASEHDPRYFELLLRTGLMLTRYKDVQQGSINRRRSLPWKVFCGIVVAVPALPEQRRIVDLVGALDDTIAGGQSSYLAAAEARLALCRAAQSTAAPTLISEIAEVSQGKSFPKASQGVTTGDTPWFKIADMAQAHNVHGYVRAETALSVSEIVRLGGVIIQPGAVVFPRVGAAVLTEKKRLVLVPGAVDENHLVLTPLEGVGSDLLLTVMDNLRLSGLVQSGAVPSLNMGLVRATAVQWPTERAAELDSVLGDFRRSLEAGATLLQRLRLLRSNFLASLLSGEHEIPESYDELMGEAS